MLFVLIFVCLAYLILFVNVQHINFVCFIFFLGLISVGAVLFGIQLASMTVSFAWDLYLDQRGCCDLTKACDYRKEYETAKKQVEVNGNAADVIYNNGTNFFYYKQVNFLICSKIVP